MSVAPTRQYTKTPSQKHTQARQAQAMNRLGGIVVLLLLLGVPAVAAALLLYALARKNRRRLGILALGMLVGLVVVGLGYQRAIAEAQAIVQLATPYQGALRELARKPDAQHWQTLQPAVRAILPHIGRLWLIALPLAPLVALYLESTRTRNVTEQREERERRERAREQERRRQAAQKVKRAPDAVGDLAVIGVPLAGDLDWTRKGWAVYTPQMLNRHAVIIGAAGAGKTEFILRVAYLARKVYGWKVFYIDAKGDREVAERFVAAMRSAHAERRLIP